MSLLDRLNAKRRRWVSDSPARVHPEPALAAPKPLVPPGLGQRDAEASGWLQRATGELFGGFAAYPGAVVLDVGCGESPHAAFFADMDVEIIVADIVPEYVTAAARAVRHAGTTARVRELVTDVDPLPLPDASVDRIVATEVLEHVSDPVAFLAEIVRVGKPGAVYLLSVPDARSEQLQAPFAAPDYFEQPNHVRVFSDDAFDQLVGDGGLEIVHKQYDGFYQSLWWCFFWLSGQPDAKPPWRPLMGHWMRTWHELLQSDGGPELKRALDAMIPKSQVVVARKP